MPRHEDFSQEQQFLAGAAQQAAYVIGPPLDFAVAGNAPNVHSPRYTVLHVIGQGSQLVCAARNDFTGELVAMKKIVFSNVADASSLLREITLLRLLKHHDIVEIKHIMLPADPNNFNNLYVAFELMESDLHTVIAANDDFTPDHHCVFLYQLLRGLNFMHTNKVLHRDLQPKNILANHTCKLKICDFGLALLSLDGVTSQSPVMSTKYAAPELCGQFYGEYTGAADMWSVGCIFAEVLLGQPLFPGSSDNDSASQLTMMTDLLGRPPQSFIDAIPNDAAREWLNKLSNELRPKPLAEVFPHADPEALDLLAQLLAFDPARRPTPAIALTHPYFGGLPAAAAAPLVPVVENLLPFGTCEGLTLGDVRRLIYQEALHYYPQLNV